MSQAVHGIVSIRGDATGVGHAGAHTGRRVSKHDRSLVEIRIRNALRQTIERIVLVSCDSSIAIGSRHDVADGVVDQQGRITARSLPLGMRETQTRIRIE